jgi:hypothetical protein
MSLALLLAAAVVWVVLSARLSAQLLRLRYCFSVSFMSLKFLIHNLEML